MTSSDRNSPKNRTLRTAGQALAGGVAVEILDILGVTFPPMISIVVVAVIAAALVKVLDFIGGPLDIDWDNLEGRGD